MKEITRARSEVQRLVIEYNELGQPIGQSAMKLKSFIGTTIRFHVSITYSDWPTAGFMVDPRSKKTIIQNAGKKSENGKEKRKQHKYNHRTSRKGYANLMEELKASSSDQIDRSIVWKQARMDQKGQIPDEEMKEVVNLIDELVATQKTTNAFSEEDILTRALGGKDRPGIVNIAKDDEQVEGVTLEKMKEVGSHILWPRHLVITDNMKMDYREFTENMTTFAPTPIQNAPVALQFLLRMVEHMGYLYTRVESSRTLNLYKFVGTGSISCGSSKEERAQLLIARHLEQVMINSY
ncbi:putative serine/threonine-protein kinase nek2 [Cucumis melo var. makuwa]|uniref:Putative serine/threonine-protein kinase nek2 n=1 Tax=Cucumis melo var. makuwa TaxID=1194695 RepID=A0A5D3BEQ8_CUCMM|nr:putative serine/threonine-protein kinase nek2 [Cucumis melo var. makuwa]